MTVRVRFSPVLSALTGVVVAGALLSACRGKDPETPANQGAGGSTAWGTPGQGGNGAAPAAQGGYANAPAQGGYANAPATTTTGPAPTATATTAPPPTTTASPPPIDPSVLQALLTPLAQKHAPGAKPEGSPIAGMAQQGTPLTTAVTIQPSGTKCYTAIAVGAPPITDLVVELWASPPPPLPPTVLSQSSTTGVEAVMAGKPNCFKNLLPIPIPGTLKVTARAGSGLVLAQLYAK